MNIILTVSMGFCQYAWSSEIINESVSSFTPSISSAISYSTFDVGMDYLSCVVQGWTKRLWPGLVNMRRKNYVLLPAAGR